MWPTHYSIVDVKLFEMLHCYKTLLNQNEPWFSDGI